jgi:hypothetical protein
LLNISVQTLKALARGQSKPGDSASGKPLIQECKAECSDDSGRKCPCKELTTITFYVQKGAAPLSIVADYASDKLSKNTPQPNTGHTFIAIGDGSLSQQEAYGFYPVESWFGGKGGINTNKGFYVPGEAEPKTDIYDPENTHANTHKQSFKACPSAVSAMQASIQQDIEAIKKNDANSPVYSLSGLQCTTWARQKLASIGFKDPGGISPHGASGKIPVNTK